MADGQLLRFFGFTKSLEEIDQMDQVRLSQALEALSYYDAWKRHHTPKPATPGARRMFARKQESGLALDDQQKVFELVELAAKWPDL